MQLSCFNQLATVSSQTQRHLQKAKNVAKGKSDTRQRQTFKYKPPTFADTFNVLTGF
jgi:hypothetical protein